MEIPPHEYGKVAKLLNEKLRFPMNQHNIINHLKQDHDCLSTTMVDYYALPQQGNKAWPGREMAGTLPFAQKAAMIENALLADICREIGDGFDPHRFIPFVIMHEFEGLLFSDCQGFGRGIERPELAVEFQLIRDQFSSPEEINDSPVTAPSKRVEELVAGYEKPLLGTLAILEIGLAAIRTECPHFHEWLIRLENWHG
ncbi:MAG: DUF4276 family protein [Candidatus Desantisbacteria bacterium]